MAEQGKSRRRILREIQFMQQQTKSGEPINIKKMQEYLDEYSAIRQIIYLINAKTALLDSIFILISTNKIKP